MGNDESDLNRLIVRKKTRAQYEVKVWSFIYLDINSISAGDFRFSVLKKNSYNQEKKLKT